MENRADTRSTSFYILRFVRVSRILLLASVIGIQTKLGFQYGIMHFLYNTVAPFFVILMDVLMFNKTKDDFKEYYLVSIIICLIAIVTTWGSIVPVLLLPYLMTFGLATIYLLYFGVTIVSLTELVTLIYRTRPQKAHREDGWDEKRDTIDIQ